MLDKSKKSISADQNNLVHMSQFRKIFLFLIFVLFSTGLTTFYCLAQRRDLNLVKPEIAFTLSDKSLFPEGIAYDSKTRQFFISSLSKFKVVSVDRKGKQSDFIPSSQDSILRCVCVKTDEKSRRLWVLSTSGWSEKVISGIHVYHIDTRQLIAKRFTPLGNKPVFNDMIIGYQGEALILDYEGNCIYSYKVETNRLEILIESELLAGANGVTISPDQTTLFVNTRNQGIVLVDVITKKISPVSNPLSLDLKGLDGITFYKNSLIAVMCKDDVSENPLIIRYFLNKSGNEIIGASIIDYKNPLFSIPTNGAMVGDIYFCLAATHLHHFSLNMDQNNENLSNPLVLKYNLNPK